MQRVEDAACGRCSGWEVLDLKSSHPVFVGVAHWGAMQSLSPCGLRMEKSNFCSPGPSSVEVTKSEPKVGRVSAESGAKEKAMEEARGEGWVRGSKSELKA